MKVFQIRVKLYLLKSIKQDETQEKIASFIDCALGQEEILLEMHKSKDYKSYCFDSLYPVEDDKEYKKDKIYTVTIRTIEPVLARFFLEELVHFYNLDFKAIISECKEIQKKYIERIYSMTPCLIKDDRGYWKRYMNITEFEERIRVNLIKKHNFNTNSKINEDFPLFTNFEVKNIKPIATSFKGMNMLGDKINAIVADNEQAQEIIYMALATGILENNSRGFGFINFRYL